MSLREGKGPWDRCLLVPSTNSDLIIIKVGSFCQILEFTRTREGNEVRETQEHFDAMQNCTKFALVTLRQLGENLGEKIFQN